MNRSADTDPLEGALHFDALLTPHRSLSRKGFVILMCGIALICFLEGLFFLSVGAWPVFGFFILDVGLIYFAFKLNYRAGRAHETVQLSDRELKIRRVDPAGRIQAWSFEPYWARVQFDEGDEEDVRIDLVSHGKYLSVGNFLAPEERVDFGETLKRALATWRDRPFHEADMLT